MRPSSIAAFGGLILLAACGKSSPPVTAAAAVPAADAAQYAMQPADPENTLLLDLSTGGEVRIRLRPDKAPLSVERIKALTRQGFYNGLTFHRVIEGFMAQTGDPKGDGSGGSAMPNVKAEFNDLPHVRGTVSMARAEDRNSANSQFFIMLSPNLKLDGKYSPFGRVVSGIAWVDAIEKGEPPANPSRIVRARIEADGDAPPVPAPPVPAEPPAVTTTPVAPSTPAEPLTPAPEAPAPVDDAVTAPPAEAPTLPLEVPADPQPQ